MFIVSIVAFFMLRLIPGDIIDLMLADFGYAADRAVLEAQLGLDQPVYTQFFSWFFGLLSGDLGDSLWTSRTVADELSVRYPVTIELAIIALTVSIVVSIPIGIITAVRQDTWVDYALRSTSISPQSSKRPTQTGYINARAG